MYCVNCGKEINDGMTFCPACGGRQDTSVHSVAVIENRTSDAGFNITQINQATVNAIYNLLDPLKRIAEENRIISICQKSIRANEAKAKNLPGYSLLGFIIGMMPVYMITGSALGFCPALVCGIIGGTIGFLMSMSSRNTVNRNKARMDTCLNRINDICSEVDPADMSLLPPSYRFYNAAAFFYHAFTNQRALTMQQAVNLYEDEMRKDQMALMQRQQMTYLRSIRTSSAVSATANTLNFISKLF